MAHRGTKRKVDLHLVDELDLVPLRKRKYPVSKDRGHYVRGFDACEVCNRNKQLLFTAFKGTFPYTTSVWTCGSCSRYCILCQIRWVKSMFKERVCVYQRTGGYDSDPDYGYSDAHDTGLERHDEPAHNICLRCSKQLPTCDGCGRVSLPLEKALTRLSNGRAYCRHCLLQASMLCMNVRCEAVLDLHQSSSPFCRDCEMHPKVWCAWCKRVSFQRPKVRHRGRIYTMEMWSSPPRGASGKFEWTNIPESVVPQKKTHREYREDICELYRVVTRNTCDKNEDKEQVCCSQCFVFCDRCAAPIPQEPCGRVSLRNTSRFGFNQKVYHDGTYCGDCETLLHRAGLVTSCFRCARITDTLELQKRDGSPEHVSYCHELNGYLLPNTLSVRSLLICLLVVDGKLCKLMVPLLEHIIDYALGVYTVEREQEEATKRQQVLDRARSRSRSRSRERRRNHRSRSRD